MKLILEVLREVAAPILACKSKICKTSAALLKSASVSLSSMISCPYMKSKTTSNTTPWQGSGRRGVRSVREVERDGPIDNFQSVSVTLSAAGATIGTILSEDH